MKILLLALLLQFDVIGVLYPVEEPIGPGQYKNWEWVCLWEACGVA